MIPHTGSGRWRLAHRLAWRLVLVMLGAMALAVAAVSWRTVATIRSIDDAALQSQARLVAAQLSAGPDGSPVLTLPKRLASVFDQGDGQSLFIVYDQHGRVVQASQGQAVEAIQPYLPPRPLTRIFRVPGGGAYPDGLLGLAIPAGPWQVVVAQAAEQNEALVGSLVREFLMSAFWVVLPIGALTVLIGVLTIRNGLRSMKQASAAAQRVGTDQPGVRLPESGLPDEVLPLVRAVNQGLSRLEQTLDAQRRFVGDAAHALRTPLSVLTARIDGLPEGADARALRADVDRMARMVGQLLAMARLEELPLDRSGHFDLRSVAVSVISEMVPLGLAKQVDLTLSGGRRMPELAGSRDAVRVALTNLVHNALTYAPPRSEVEVELLASPPTVRVLDRGPGVPESQRTTIFQRFTRGPSAAEGGSGLGLAIVAEVAAAHGGKAYVEPRPGGGSIFVMELGDEDEAVPVPEPPVTRSVEVEPATA